MDYKELTARLRSVESRSKGGLLEQAAVAIETLVARLDAAEAERNVVHKRVIEVEQELAALRQERDAMKRT